MRAAWVMCAIAFLAACARKGPPSPEYAEARAEFNALYGRLLEDAYLSPEMRAIEEKLERVPQTSEDHPRAEELLLRIRSGRERLEGQIAERQAAVQSDLEGTQDSPFQRGEEDAGASASAADASGEQPAAGMSVAQFRSRFGMCFEPGEDIEVVGKGNRSTFVLRNMALCRERHPGFDRRMVVVEGERLLAIAEEKDLQIVGADAGAR
ncbi:MAG TPA: hypothetical protein VE549_07790 [Myxococcaceae bacterium]|nr:hypothetical protein [Myxococcaceae bacterium]